MALPILPLAYGGYKLYSHIKDVDRQIEQENAARKQNIIDATQNARAERALAQQNYQPSGRVGVGGMNISGEAMQRQNILYESILNKYGGGGIRTGV